MAVHRDGVTRFPQEAVERFQVAQKALSEGMRWGEAMQLLQERFGAVYDVGQSVEVETKVTSDALALQDIGSKLDRLVAAVEALAAAQKENSNLMERVDKLEAALTKTEPIAPNDLVLENKAQAVVEPSQSKGRKLFDKFFRRRGNHGE